MMAQGMLAAAPDEVRRALRPMLLAALHFPRDSFRLGGLLLLLDGSPGLSHAAYARRLNCPVQAVSRLFGVLQRRGLATATPSAANRNVLECRLLPKGTTLVTDLEAAASPSAPAQPEATP